MKHTERMKRAIQFSLKKHDGQYRKEVDRWPYATHVILVGMLLAEFDADEDTIIAGLLHDTIEDTGTTGEEIESLFGARVRLLVEAVTEPREKSVAWKERKTAYLRNIEAADDNALLISISDKIDNVESKIAVYEKEGEGTHMHWSQPTSEYLWFHAEVAKLAQERLPHHPLTKRLLAATKRENELFGSHVSV